MPSALVAQSVKSLPAVQEPWVGLLGQEEDPQRKKWQLTPVSLPGKSRGQKSLAGCSPWGHKESGKAGRLTLTLPLRISQATKSCCVYQKIKKQVGNLQGRKYKMTKRI